MNGEVRSVFGRVHSELIEPMIQSHSIPRGFLGEMCSAVGAHMATPHLTYSREREKTVSDVQQVEARIALAQGDEGEAAKMLASLSKGDFVSESAAVAALHAIRDALKELELDDLAADYPVLLSEFVQVYSLGYYVDAAATLHGTMTSVMTDLFGELRRVAAATPHTCERMAEFEHAVADALKEPAENRQKTALQKLVNLLEALGHLNGGDPGETLGAMCRGFDDWPHSKLKESGAALVKFTNNYPGIRHGGDPDSKLRDLDERDFVSVTMGLLALVPYLSESVCDSAGVLRFGDGWSSLTSVGVGPLWEVS